MKAFLNRFRQLSEVNFRNSRVGREHNAVRFDPAYGSVLKFFPSTVLKSSASTTDVKDRIKNVRVFIFILLSRLQAGILPSHLGLTTTHGLSRPSLARNCPQREFSPLLITRAGGI